MHELQVRFLPQVSNHHRCGWPVNPVVPIAAGWGGAQAHACRSTRAGPYTSPCGSTCSSCTFACRTLQEFNCAFSAGHSRISFCFRIFEWPLIVFDCFFGAGLDFASDPWVILVSQVCWFTLFSLRFFCAKVPYSWRTEYVRSLFPNLTDTCYRICRLILNISMATRNETVFV